MRAIRRLRLRWLVAGLLMLGGCGDSLRVRAVSSTHDKPSNVWVLLTVDQGDRPIPDLSAGDFSIFEDGRLVAPADSKQVIQSVERVSVRQTLVLVDMSGAIAASGRAGAIADAVGAFTERVGKTQKVGVYAFDGAEKLHPIVAFERGAGGAEGGVDALRAFKPEDTSTNLRGAVVEGLHTLRRSLERDSRSVKLGTLVVISNGPDRAARLSSNAMEKEIESEAYRGYELYAIGLGPEARHANLDDIGRDATEIVGGDGEATTVRPSDVTMTMARLAARLEGRQKRLYLLSYCTPARRGKHEVRIEAHTRGQAPSAGSLYATFDADGFGTPPECDPRAPPAFATRAPLLVESAAKSADSDKADKADKADGDRRTPPPNHAPTAHATSGASTVIEWKPAKPAGN